MTVRNSRRGPVMCGVAVLVAVCLGLASCGGSSKGGSSPTSGSSAPAGTTARAVAPTPTPSTVTRVSPSSSTGNTGLTLGKTQVTQYSATVCDFSPAVSRDGSHVTFVRGTRASASAACPTAGTIEVVAADGSGLKDLGTGTQPFFSADGSTVGFFNAPDTSGCLAGVQLVTTAGEAVATIKGSFSATEANDPLSPDGKDLLLNPCSGTGATIVEANGTPGPAMTFPATLGLGANPVVTAFGWTTANKGVVMTAAAKFLLVDPATGAASAAPSGTIALIQTRTPWEFQLDLWNPSLPLGFQ